MDWREAICAGERLSHVVPRVSSASSKSNIQTRREITTVNSPNKYREHLHIHAKTNDALPTAARFLIEAKRPFVFDCWPLKSSLRRPWLYRTVSLSRQVGLGSIRSIRRSMTSPSKPTTTMPSPPATSWKQRSPLQRSLVSHLLLSCFISNEKLQTYDGPDVLGSMAFTPVKNDMIGNIKVFTHPRPCTL